MTDVYRGNKPQRVNADLKPHEDGAFVAAPKAVLRSALSRSFWSGFLTYMFFRMFYEDLVGKEYMLRAYEQDWVDLHWGIGLTLFAAVVWYFSKLVHSVCGKDPLP